MEEYLDPFLLKELHAIILNYHQFGGINVATLHTNGWPTCLTTLPRQHIAAGLENGTIEVWDLEYGQVELMLIPPNRAPLSIIGLGTVPSGQLVAASVDTILLWDLLRGLSPRNNGTREEGNTTTKTSHLLADSGSNAFRHLITLPNFIAATLSNGDLRIWNIRILKQEANLRSKRGNYLAMAPLPLVNNETRIAVSAGRHIEVINITAKRVEIALEHDAVINHIVTPPNTIIASSNRTVWVWDALTYEVSYTLKTDSVITCLTILPDIVPTTYRIIAGTVSGKIWVWTSGDLSMILEAHTGLITDVVALPDAQLVSSSYDGTLKMWV